MYWVQQNKEPILSFIKIASKLRD